MKVLSPSVVDCDFKHCLIKIKTINLVFAALLLSMQHYGARPIYQNQHSMCEWGDMSIMGRASGAGVLVLCAGMNKKDHKEHFKEHKGHLLMWKLKCNACHLMIEIHNKYYILCFMGNLNIHTFENCKILD